MIVSSLLVIASSVSFDFCSPFESGTDRAFSLRNLGAMMESFVFSANLTYSEAWFRRRVFGFGAQLVPSDVVFIVLRINGSILRDGAPTSKTIWPGHAESRVSR